MRPERRPDVWIDVKNSHEPAFFHSIIRRLEPAGVSVLVTARDYAEILALLDLRGIGYVKVGGHHGSNIIAKAFGRIVLRNAGLLRTLPKFRMALSHMSAESAMIGRLRGVPTASVGDNDLPQMYTDTQLGFIDHLFFPDAIPSTRWRGRFGSPRKLEPFAGYKEDVYLADFAPDPRFLEQLPVRDYVVVRPEAVKAEYYPKGERSIVPEILNALASEGLPVVYLPRYREDRELAAGVDGVWMPPKPLNGLDLCWNARAVLTGSGTMAREAALLGVPAVQFIPGHNLAVDRALESKGWLAHLRDPKEIVRLATEAKRRSFDQERPRAVLARLMERLKEILDGRPAA